jgi:hypothetical protein
VTICSVCQVPTFNHFLCLACWTTLSLDLRDVAGTQLDDHGRRMMSLSLELEISLSRQERRANVAVMISSSPENPLPVNLHAGRVRDRLHAVLAGWVAHLQTALPYYGLDTGTTVENAQWLLDHESVVRGFLGVDELVEQVTEAIEAARRTIDNRSVRVYVGECGAEIEATEHEEAFVCTTSLWADSAYAMCRCAFCGTSWASMDRWESYLSQVRDGRLEALENQHLGPRRMAKVLVSLGLPVDESTIRKYAKLGKLACSGLDSQGRKIYRTGDVMALLAGEDSLTG